MRILVFILVYYVCGFFPPVELASFGKVLKVGGIFPIHSENNGTCGKINMAAVQEIEAVNWVFKKLNDDQYIKGVTIEFHPTDSCGVTDKALSLANAFAQDFDENTCSDQTDFDVISIIGPKNNEETLAVSRLVSSMPSDKLMAQISYASSSPGSVDRSLHKNVFRIVPTKTATLKAVVTLLQELEWTYIAIIRSELGTNQEEMNFLKQLSANYDICVVETFNVSARSQLHKYLRDIAVLRANRVTGFVLLDSNDLADLFMSVLKSDNSFRNIMAIVIEDPNRSFVPHDDPPLLGLFKIRLFSWSTYEFQTYWEERFTDMTFDSEQSSTTAFLSSLYRDITQCTQQPINKCPKMTISDIKELMPMTPLVSYVIQAALVMARAFKTLHETKCGNYNGACAKFRSSTKTDLVTVLETINVDFQHYTRTAVPNSFFEEKLNIRFNENGEVVLPDTIQSHEIMNFQKCHETGVGFCFEKVGNYSATRNALHLNKELIQQFSEDDREILWNDMEKAQCPHNMVCSECHEESTSNHIYTKTGDLYIVAIVPIHNRGKGTQSCGEIRMTGGFEVSEAIAYAIESAKEHHLAVPEVDVGVIVIDSCDNDLEITERILSLHSTGLKMSDGGYIDVSDKIIGYIGGLGSGVSVASAEILKNLGFVQVSYGSTTSLLSDRNKFPYFLRVTTSDDKQAAVLLSIVKKLNVNYIQLVYSQGTYGEGGMVNIQKHAKQMNICISQSLVVNDDDTDNYKRIVEKIKQNSFAKVVIVFLRSHTAIEFLKVLNNDVDPGEYIFLGSEGWANKDFAIDLMNLEGAITLSSTLPHYKGFITHMAHVSPESDPDNPWVKAYMSSRLGCYYEKSFNKTAGRVCGENARLDSQINYRVDTWTPFSILATHALLRGAHDTLQALCGNTKNLCEQYQKRPKELISSLKRVKLDPMSQQQQVYVFNDNGDGILGYTIWNLRKAMDDPNILTYSQVGRTTTDGHIDFEMSQLVFLDDVSTRSSCDEEICPECFTERFDEIESMNNLEDCISSQVMYITFAVLGAVTGILLVITLCLLTRRKKKILKKQAPSIVVLRGDMKDNLTEGIYSEIDVDNDMNSRFGSGLDSNIDTRLPGTIKDGYLIPDSDTETISSGSFRNMSSMRPLLGARPTSTISMISGRSTNDRAVSMHTRVYARIPNIPLPDPPAEYLEMT